MVEYDAPTRKVESTRCRIYSNMKIEDYPPYKALNLSLGLFGPTPYNPTECACGRLGRIEEIFCMCASSCMSHPKYSLYKANPDLYKAEQNELRILKRRYLEWIKQRSAIEQSNWLKSRSLVYEFERLRDKESPIDCWECEQDKWKHYCTCCCDNCGSKWCNDQCRDDDEY